MVSKNKLPDDVHSHIPSTLENPKYGVVKAGKTQPCGSCQGFGWYSDFGYDEPRQKECEACHGLGYEEEQPND